MALITLAISWGYDLTSHTRDHAQTSADLLQLLLLILEQKASSMVLPTTRSPLLWALIRIIVRTTVRLGHNRLQIFTSAPPIAI